MKRERASSRPVSAKLGFECMCLIDQHCMHIHCLGGILWKVLDMRRKMNLVSEVTKDGLVHRLEYLVCNLLLHTWRAGPGGK